MNNIENGILSDVIFNIMSISLDLDIICMKNVNKLFYNTSKQFKCHIDVLYHCLLYSYLNCYHYFNNNHCSLDTLYAMIEFNHFDLLEMKKLPSHFYNDKLLIYAIYSNNVKMVRYIKNRMVEINDIYKIYNDIASVDNIDIYNTLIDRRIIMDQVKVHMLVSNNSINIIELIRFRLAHRKIFENAITAIANQQNNHFMINYCAENDYGKH